MATDTFLYFEEPGPGAPPIEGETTDKEFQPKKALEIESYDLGYSNRVDVGSATGGSGASRVDFGPLTINIRLDSSFTAFMQSCASGGHYGKATIVRRRAGTDKEKVGSEFFKIEMKKVFISSVNFNVAGAGPHVGVKLDYGAIRWSYTPQTATGATAPKIEKEWSQILNKATFAV